MSKKSSFRQITVSQLGKIITGNTPPRKVKDYFGKKAVWIKPTDIQIGSRFIGQTEEKFSEKACEKYKSSLLPPLSTCVVTIGNVGKKICLTKENSFTNQAINAIIPNTSEFDPLFIFYIMKYNLRLVELRHSGTASGRHNISKSSFGNIKLKVPDLPSQKIIGWVIGKFDDLIENYSQQNKILEEKIKLVFNEWFVHLKFPGCEKTELIDSNLGQIPKGWRTIPLVEKINVIYGFAFKSKFFNPKDGKPVVRIRNLESNFTAILTTEKCDKKYNIFDGDILAGMDGEFNTDIWYGGDALLNQRVCKFVGKTKELSNLFIYFSLKDKIKNVENKTVGTTVIHLSKSDIDNLQITLPDEKLLIRFSNMSQTILRNMINNEKKIRSLKNIKKCLIPKFMSGKIKSMDLGIKIPA